MAFEANPLGRQARQRPRRVVARPGSGQPPATSGPRPSWPPWSVSSRARPPPQPERDPVQVRDPERHAPLGRPTTSAASPASKPPQPSTAPLGHPAGHTEPHPLQP
jgi:hypothetical protein